MTGEVACLEKYSVAPAPSRDYYGIRILPNEVLVFRWKISHGPHKSPIVRKVSFEEFAIEKSLQDEIYQVFGQSPLEFVRDVAHRGTAFWAENSSELDRGWARVFIEGRAMQQTDAEHVPQRDKKRGIRRNSSLIRHRENIFAKSRSKTPLDIVKTNHAAKKMIENSTNVENGSLMPGDISLRQVDDACVKISTSDFQINKLLHQKINPRAKDVIKNLDRYKSLVQYKSTDHEKNTTSERQNLTKNHKTSPIPQTERNKLTERTKKSVKSSKSTILKTREALTKGIASAQKNDVNLGDLIRQNAKSTASSTDDPRYLSCFDYFESLAGDLKKSTDSSSSNNNYEIENSRSLNSSLASTDSIKNGCGSETPSKANEIASLMSKYEKTRKYLAEQLRAEEEKMLRHIEQKTKRNVGKIPGKSALRVPEILHKIPTRGNARPLDPRKNKHVEQSTSKSSLVPKTSLLLSKFINPSPNSRSKLKTESTTLRKKQKN